MAGLEDMVTASQIAAAIDMLRFDKAITSFEFQPSLGLVAKRLAALGEEFADLREPLKKSVRDVMTISILENFVSGGRPDWEELAYDTLKRRKKENSGTMILVRQGTLAEVASSERVWSIGRTSATIRDLPDKVWYGKIHQGGYSGDQFAAGSWFKKYQNAARKALGPDEDDAEVDKLAFKMFDQRLAKHGPAPRGAPAIPARPFAVFQDEDIDAIENIFVDWIEEKVREAGFR